jgi:hypothetical protein
MALPDAQKGFYDSRRYFQGRDNPDAAPAPPPTASRGIPMSQLVVGIVFLGLIVLAFFSFALPKPETAPAGHGTPPAAAQPQTTAH